MTPTLLWFRQDLRLADNPALAAALDRGGPVIPVYIWSPEEEGGGAPGAASRWWLHQALVQLTIALGNRGSRLVIRRGPALDTLRTLGEETGSRTLHWNRRYEPAAIARDTAVKSALTKEGWDVESFNSSLLFEPRTVLNKSGNPFQVFTPFYKHLCSLDSPAAPLPAPNALPLLSAWPESISLADLNLEPSFDWTAGLRETWQAGEAGADAALQRFLEKGVTDYPTERDRPDHQGTSRLSPYLHFGELSPRTVWHAVQDHAVANRLPALRAGADAWLRQLGWREFAHHLLFHFPHTPTDPLRPEYAAFPWQEDEEDLVAWQQGRTGFPIVDAGMRQLWQTGWMHNRVRMIAASFLIKDLLQPWQEGAAWFWDTLVDADLANNTMGWQWVAGCGADASPFFRVFNPMTQGERFDPQGDYVRTWLPELADLPAAWIHRPWEAPAEVRTAAGVELGVTYPQPIVDHQAARLRALDALQVVKQAKQ